MPLSLSFLLPGISNPLFFFLTWQTPTHPTRPSLTSPLPWSLPNSHTQINSYLHVTYLFRRLSTICLGPLKGRSCVLIIFVAPEPITGSSVSENTHLVNSRIWMAKSTTLLLGGTAIFSRTFSGSVVLARLTSTSSHYCLCYGQWF